METEQTSHRFSAISPNHKKLMNSSEKKLGGVFFGGKKKKTLKDKICTQTGKF